MWQRRGTEYLLGLACLGLELGASVWLEQWGGSSYPLCSWLSQQKPAAGEPTWSQQSLSQLAGIQ